MNIAEDKHASGGSIQLTGGGGGGGAVPTHYCENLLSQFSSYMKIKVHSPLYRELGAERRLNTLPGICEKKTTGIMTMRQTKFDEGYCFYICRVILFNLGGGAAY